MDLSDALDGGFSGGNQPGNPTWPGQPGANPAWPGGQPGANPAWPGGPSGGGGPWPGGNPNQPSWPSPQPNAPGGWPSPGPGPGIPAAAQQILTVPYNHNLSMGVYNKMLITIAGSIKPNANMFTVDLATPSDLAFHFNVRFNEHGKKVIVRNSCFGTKWGKEERQLQNFPFVQGKPFEMKILCTDTEFKVAVNSAHLLEFKYRFTNLSLIKMMNIYYDVTLSKVSVETLP
uniref:Galectin n=1 Tax=Monopterus albus TaxID=43700 RepID=A0A3Q3K4H7_MONAL|nr:galectin-3-like [Monopterus albus]XP_020442029.1 galectin-3-like [Monopterus albus]